MRPIVFLLLILAVSACGGGLSPEEREAKWKEEKARNEAAMRQELEAFFTTDDGSHFADRFYKVNALIDSARLGRARELDSIRPIDEELCFYFDGDSCEMNAFLAYEEFYFIPENHPYKKTFFVGEDHFRVMGENVITKELHRASPYGLYWKELLEEVKGEMKKYEALEYLFVLVKTSSQKAEFVEGIYRRGNFNSRTYVYNIDSGELLNIIDHESLNSEFLVYERHVGKGDDFEYKVLLDMLNNINETVHRELRRQYRLKGFLPYLTYKHFDITEADLAVPTED